MPMNDRTRQHLINTGRLTPTGYGRGARLITCPRCWGLIIHGLDNGRCAIEAEADPVKLNPRTEAIALLNGLTTYELWGTELERRDYGKIRGGQDKPVVASHLCGVTITPSIEIIRLWHPNAGKPPTDKDTPCPF